MDKLLEALFPQGKRKVVVSVVALIVGLVLEKFGGGLSENMQTSLIAIVAIFTGGNIMEHLADALKIIKGTKLGQIIEDAIPGDQGLGMDVSQKEERDPVAELAMETNARFQAIEAAQKQQAQNTAVLIDHVKRLQQPKA